MPQAIALPLRSVALLLALCGGCSHLGAGSGARDESPVVAELNGEPITQAELDAWIQRDLFERESSRGPSKLYELRSAGLDRMLTERVVDAARAGSELDGDAWLKQKLAEEGGVTSDEVASFYQKNKERLGGAPLEQVAGQISRYLEAEKGARIVAQLREQAEIRIHLVAPRLQVAATGPSKGPDSARVTIIEFSDFQCPFCRREAPVVNEVLGKYPSDVRLVYRHLPLTNIHPRAQAAAEASLCAHEQGRFWEYHDRLFDAPGKFTDADLSRMAGEAGLDARRYAGCVEERRYRAAVDEDAKAAEAAGITGTPAFLINGILLSGAQPASAFFKLIDRELAAAPASGAAAQP